MSQKDFNAWRKTYQIPALYNTIDTVGVNSLKTLPYWYQVAINQKGEVIVGENILWYSQTGEIHYVPEVKQTDLAGVKAGTVTSIKTDTWEVTTVQLPAEKVARMNLSGSDARWQYQFYANGDPNSIRKYVFELQNVRSGGFYSLNINMKLEWYGSVSHTWQTASDWRHYFWNVGFDATLHAGGVVSPELTGYTHSSDPYSGWLDNTNHTVNLTSYYAPSGFGGYWDVEVTGGLEEMMDNQLWQNDWSAPTSPNVPLW